MTGKTCDSCKHWDRSQGTPANVPDSFGECDCRIDVSREDDCPELKSTEFVTIGVDHWWGSHLYTGPHFGCIRHVIRDLSKDG